MEDDALVRSAFISSLSTTESRAGSWATSNSQVQVTHITLHINNPAIICKNFFFRYLFSKPFHPFPLIKNFSKRLSNSLRNFNLYKNKNVRNCGWTFGGRKEGVAERPPVWIHGTAGEKRGRDNESVISGFKY
jgi:hypothetical protein